MLAKTFDVNYIFVCRSESGDKKPTYADITRMKNNRKNEQISAVNAQKQVTTPQQQNGSCSPPVDGEESKAATMSADETSNDGKSAEQANNKLNTSGAESEKQASNNITLKPTNCSLQADLIITNTEKHKTSGEVITNGHLTSATRGGSRHKTAYHDRNNTSAYEERSGGYRGAYRNTNGGSAYRGGRGSFRGGPRRSSYNNRYTTPPPAQPPKNVGPEAPPPAAAANQQAVMATSGGR